MFFAQILLNSIVIGTQVLLLALALYLVYAVSKTFHLALGGIGTSLAYSLYFGISNEYHLLLSILLTIILAIFLGMISYLLLEPFIRKQEYMLGMLIGFPFLIILESLIAIIFGSDGKSLIQGVLPIIKIGELYITIPGMFTIILGICLIIISYILVRKTPWGRTLEGVSKNLNLAKSLMIHTAKIRFLIFIFTSFIAGLIIIFSSMNTSLSPYGSFDLLIMAFLALLIGGVKDIRGMIMASFIITIIPELIISSSIMSWNISANLKMFFVFILSIVLLLWRPNGLLFHRQRLS